MATQHVFVQKDNLFVKSAQKLLSDKANEYMAWQINLTMQVSFSVSTKLWQFSDCVEDKLAHDMCRVILHNVACL